MWVRKEASSQELGRCQRLYFQNITNLTTLPLWSRPDLCDQAHPSLPASFHHWPQSVLSPAVKGPAGAMLLTLELDQPASAHATRGFPRQSKQNPKSAWPSRLQARTLATTLELTVHSSPSFSTVLPALSCCSPSNKTHRLLLQGLKRSRCPLFRVLAPGHCMAVHSPIWVPAQPAPPQMSTSSETIAPHPPPPAA